MSPMNERGVDFGYRLDRSFDRDFRKAVKVGLGVSVSSEIVAMVSRVVRGGVCPRWLDCGVASGTRVMVGRVRVGLFESAHQVTTPGAAAGRVKRSARASTVWLREALFDGVAGPPRIDGDVLFERGLHAGRRHRHLDEGAGWMPTSVAFERWCR